MFGLSAWEIILVMAVALIAVGPRRMPQLIRTLAEAMRTVRRASTEVRTALEEPLREVREPLNEMRAELSGVVEHASRYGATVDAEVETLNEHPAFAQVSEPGSTAAGDDAAIQAAPLEEIPSAEEEETASLHPPFRSSSE